MKASNGTSSRTAARAGAQGNEASSSSTAERFTLTGPSLPLDDRVHAYRRDIADIALAGQLFAPHYARPLIRSCGVRPTMLRPQPSADAPPSSELLPGEEFAMLELSARWAWGYCRHDHYVGYVEAIDLAESVPPTHIVAAATAPIRPEPDLQVPAIAALPMGSRVPGHEDRGWLSTDLGFLPFTHVRRLDAFEHDPVAVAERLLGAPYLLGGRTSTGIDCSGLVQLALGLCGVHAPRDSDQQRALGTPLGPGDELRRGDLVSFEGHIGFMIDADRLLHATGHHGTVLVEPLAEVAARTPIVGRSRL